MNNMKVEHWCGYDIRFVEIDGEWYAILKDICDALNLRTAKVAERISPNMLERVLIEAKDSGSFEGTLNDHKPVKSINKSVIGKDIGRKRGEWKTHWMLAVNEQGIYQALFASRKLEARKFQMWTFDVLKKLRKNVGLEGYEVMRMTDPDIQEEIDWFLDSLYWDDEKKCIMQSVTIAGGDVEQVPFE